MNIATDTIPECFARLAPFLFSNPQLAVPHELISKHMLNAYTYLAPDKDSPSYLQYGATPDSRVTQLHARCVESGGDVQISHIGFKVDFLDTDIIDEVLCCVQLSGAPELCVILSYEADTWLFLTLAHAEKSKEYSETLVEAERRAKSMLYSRTSAKTMSLDLPPPEDAPKSINDMAQGEGTTPGAYGEASDFWEGWDDEGDAETQPQEPETPDTCKYWDKYDAVETVIGDENVSDTIVEKDESKIPLASDESEPATGETVKTFPVITRSRRSSTIRPPVSQKVTPPQTTMPTHFSTDQHIQTCLKGLYHLHAQSREASRSKEQIDASFLQLVQNVISHS